MGPSPVSPSSVGPPRFWMVSSDVPRRERDDDLARPPVNLRLSFQVLRKPVASRLDQRLLRLRVVPVTYRSQRRVPTALELLRDWAGGTGHRQANAHRSVRATPCVPARTSGRLSTRDGNPCMRRAHAGSKSIAACMVSAWNGSAILLGARCD